MDDKELAALQSLVGRAGQRCEYVDEFGNSGHGAPVLGLYASWGAADVGDQGMVMVTAARNAERSTATAAGTWSRRM